MDLRLSRWKYKTATVTAGENSQDVRMLTSAEMGAFRLELTKALAKEITDLELSAMTVRAAAINPVCSSEDVSQMPTDLMTACAKKILQLSGINVEDGEKKAPPSDSATTT